MKNLLNRFVADQSGATAIEYGLIAGLIAVVIIAGVTTLGTRLNAKFTTISNNLT
jgi:pilus assembly protein Flp/PilA